MTKHKISNWPVKHAEHRNPAHPEAQPPDAIDNTGPYTPSAAIASTIATLSTDTRTILATRSTM